jgi:hypothetical protein
MDVEPTAWKRKKTLPPTGFAKGIAGITWSLLTYYEIYKNDQAKRTILKALGWLKKQKAYLKTLFNDQTYSASFAGEPQLSDDVTGYISCLIKAYEVLGVAEYRSIAEELLYGYPTFIRSNDLTQNSGLSGLGEIYLEAFRVFGNEEWMQRAEYIANVLLSASFEMPGDMSFWHTDESLSPGADFMTGNGGIIHFLIRCQQKGTTSYRMIL